MSVWPKLLRVLLSISLILNGSGYAVAGSHVQMGHGDMAPSVAEQAPVSAAVEPACDHHEGDASSSVAQVADSTPEESPAKSGSVSPDCCDSWACRCACVHQAQIAPSLHALAGVAYEHAGAMHPLKSGHAAPVLANLIRPPIG